MEITRVFDLLQFSKENFNSPVALSAKREGEWKKFSISDFIGISNQMSLGLLEKGIKKDDKVAIMSTNRPEWNFTDMAIIQLGAVTVPLYPTLSEADLTFIAGDAGIRIFFVETHDHFEKLSAVAKAGNLTCEIYTFNEVEGAHNWAEIRDMGVKKDASVLQVYRNAVQPGDLLTLIYTSGTTGTPKGVMLTHANLVSNLKASTALIPPGTKTALSFLPLSHVFERMVNYLYIFSGISVYYAESTDTIVSNLNEIKPNIFTTVPRLLEKVYDRIVGKGKEQKGIKKAIFFWALNLGLAFEGEGKMGWFYEKKLALANKLVFVKWREALGNNLLAIVSGGAALQPRLSRVFTAAGITIMEGYGLTETSPVISVNTKTHLRFGTVGKVIEGDTVKIAGDGEILIKGPNVMKGYYKNQEKTKEAIDADGFFHTGDIGEIDSDGFLKITDRKKELFKTSGGKYVSPGALQNKFKESPFIEHIVIVGEDERFPAALIAPAFDHLKSYAGVKGIAFKDVKELLTNKEILDKYQKEVDQYNAGFGHWEQVKKFVLLPDEWTIDGGEMTPKLDVKRKVIIEKYKKQIEAIYAEPGKKEA